MFTIRPYQPEDRQQVEHCFAEMLNFERVLDKYTIEGEPVAAPYMDWLLAECGQKQGLIYVAEVSGEVVGLVSLYVEHQDDITTDFNEYLYISDFAVSAAHRGQGIGSALLAQAETYAREIGQKMLQLHVLTNNENALSVYRRFGLQPYVTTMLKALDY